MNRRLLAFAAVVAFNVGLPKFLAAEDYCSVDSDCNQACQDVSCSVPGVTAWPMCCPDYHNPHMYCLCNCNWLNQPYCTC
jgi:hypothetical protein